MASAGRASSRRPHSSTSAAEAIQTAMAAPTTPSVARRTAARRDMRGSYRRARRPARPRTGARDPYGTAPTLLHEPEHAEPEHVEDDARLLLRLDGGAEDEAVLEG